MEASNTSAEVGTKGRDIKEGTSGSSQPNGTMTLFDSAHTQNMMVILANNHLTNVESSE
jgi:hypothetical protein